MSRFAKLFSAALVSLGLLAGFPQKAFAVTFLDSYSSTNYIFRLYQGSYDSLASAIAGNTAFGTLLSGNQSQAESIRNDFRTTAGGSLFFTVANPNQPRNWTWAFGPLFAFGPVNSGVLAGVATYDDWWETYVIQNATWTLGFDNDSGVPLSTSATSFGGFTGPLVYATYELVPEIDGALLPQAALIAAGLFAWSRRRRVGVSAG
jgi:hypothetical protein